MNLSGVTLRTTTMIADVPGCNMSWTRCRNSSLMPRFPAAPSAAPMMPPAAPTTGASGHRKISPLSTPRNKPAEGAPDHRVMGRDRDEQPPLLVTPDDGRVLQVDQEVLVQFDDLVPDFLGRLLVRVADDDQVAHGGTSQVSVSDPSPGWPRGSVAT